jgi:arylsulfatase
MNRALLCPTRVFVLVSIWLWGSTAPLHAALPPSPLNIVVLYADDWRHDTLGAAGHPIVKTPQLDQLAAQGVRFTHNYVTTSICGVSRATLFTGQWMSRHGNKAFGAFKTPWEETYPGLLRAQGYHVGHIGKWHNGKFPGDRFDFGRAYSGHTLDHGEGRDANSRHPKERQRRSRISAFPPGKKTVLPDARLLRHPR